MYIITRGRIINLASGIVIGKNTFTIRDKEYNKEEIVYYTIQEPKQTHVIAFFKDPKERDATFDKLATKILKTQQSTFQL